MDIPELDINIVSVYGRDGCINCDSAKSLLEESNVPYIYYNCELFIQNDITKFKKNMFRMMGQHYFPYKKINFPVIFDGLTLIDNNNLEKILS